MNDTGALAKILGSYFYYSPDSKNNRELTGSIHSTASFRDTGLFDLAEIALNEHQDIIDNDYQLLFEGCGEMPAPPWGSVYLDKDSVIFGDSLLAYRQFLSQQSISIETGMREPEDQFGLMLFALAMLIEQQADETVIKTLLAEHLLPWAYRYLELVAESAQGQFYPTLAAYTRQWLEELQQTLDITATAARIYR